MTRYFICVISEGRKRMNLVFRHGHAEFEASVRLSRKAQWKILTIIIRYRKETRTK